MSYEEEQLDVIAVGAHPDDVEIGCGGVVAKLVAQGYRVGIVDLTDGEPTPCSPGPEARLAEAQAAARTLGVHRRITLALPNRKLFDTFEARLALATELRRYRPRLVLGLGEKTAMASPDHWQAMQITDAAVFYARLSKWDDQFAGSPPHKIAAQLYYSLVSYDDLPLKDYSRFVVDVSSELETKLATVRCYASQFPPEKASTFRRIETSAKYWGQAAGFEAGELLGSPRTLGTRDLMGMLGL